MADWPRQKNVGSAKNDPPTLTAYAEKKLLAKIAYDRFWADQLVFSTTYLEQAIDDFLAHQPEPVGGGDPGFWLRELKSRQGILVERFQGYFSFSHLTLQEYLAAQYVVSDRAARQLLCDQMGDRRWREVVLIAIESLEDRGIDLLEPRDCKLVCVSGQNKI